MRSLTALHSFKCKCFCVLLNEIVTSSVKQYFIITRRSVCVISWFVLCGNLQCETVLDYHKMVSICNICNILICFVCNFHLNYLNRVGTIWVRTSKNSEHFRTKYKKISKLTDPHCFKRVTGNIHVFVFGVRLMC